MSEATGAISRFFGGASFTTLGYGALYFFCSASMLLMNKLAINSYPAPALLCMIQYLFCVVAVFLLKCFNVIEVDPIKWETIKKYWPVPALFSCAIFTNNKILQYANIETFIVVRNTTPLFVSTIEFFLMGKDIPSKRSMMCFMLIIFGAVCYAVTDQGFELRSYLWAAAYLLTICTEMVFVKHIFNSVKMTVWGRMLYTNLLSIPFQPLFIFGTLEFENYPDLILTAAGLVFIFLSCVGAFGISLAGTGFRACVSATTFTLIGVVNKIFSIAVNYVMWEQHANFIGLVSLGLCLVGSTLYKPANLRETGSVSDGIFQKINSCCCNACSRSQLERDNAGSAVVGKVHPTENENEDEEKQLLSAEEKGGTKLVHMSDEKTN